MAFLNLYLVCGFIALINAVYDNYVENTNQIKEYDCGDGPSFSMQRLTCCHRSEPDYLKIEKCAKERYQIHRQSQESSKTKRSIVSPSLFDCFVPNSSLSLTHWVDDEDAFRDATLEVLECTYDNDPAWTNVIKSAYDFCYPKLSVEPHRFKLIYHTPCGARGVLLQYCISEQIFLRCPAVYWNRDLDDECNDCRELFEKCSITDTILKIHRRNYGYATPKDGW